MSGGRTSGRAGAGARRATPKKKHSIGALFFFSLHCPAAPRAPLPLSLRSLLSLSQALPLALALLLCAGVAPWWRPVAASRPGTTAADLADAGAADDARARADGLYRRAVAIR